MNWSFVYGLLCGFGIWLVLGAVIAITEKVFKITKTYRRIKQFVDELDCPTMKMPSEEPEEETMPSDNIPY